MSGIALPWFRFYHSFAGDPMVQSLAFDDQRHYVMILCLKGAGILDQDLPATKRDAIINRALGLDAIVAMEVKRRLQEVDLVDALWQPSGWEFRQFKSDVSTHRTRTYRKKKRVGSGTFRERSGNVSRNVPGTGHIQTQDTDTDTDTERNLATLVTKKKPAQKNARTGTTHEENTRKAAQVVGDEQ